MTYLLAYTAIGWLIAVLTTRDLRGDYRSATAGAVTILWPLVVAMILMEFATRAVNGLRVWWNGG